MRKQPVIPEGDAESSEGEHRKKEYDLKPVEPKMVEVERDGGHR
jgi:hypothetical protein